MFNKSAKRRLTENSLRHHGNQSKVEEETEEIDRVVSLIDPTVSEVLDIETALVDLIINLR